MNAQRPSLQPTLALFYQNDNLTIKQWNDYAVVLFQRLLNFISFYFQRYNHKILI